MSKVYIRIIVKFIKKFYLLFFKKMKAQTFEFIKMKNYQTIMGGYNEIT